MGRIREDTIDDIFSASLAYRKISIADLKNHVLDLQEIFMSPQNWGMLLANEWGVPPTSNSPTASWGLGGGSPGFQNCGVTRSLEPIDPSHFLSNIPHLISFPSFPARLRGGE